MAREILKDVHIRNAKPREKPYRLRDGGGLYLFVPPSGVRAWQYRYVLEGKEQCATLGKLSDEHGLTWARAEAERARADAAAGKHVTVEKRIARAKRAANAAATFETTAAAWVKAEARRARWTSNYEAEVEASLKNHLGKLNALPVPDITAAIAAPILRRIERDAPDMAKKVRQRLRAILDYAAEDGIISMNPIPPARRRAQVERRHLPAVLERTEVGAILRAADVSEVTRGVRRAHLLAAYTAQRVGEIVGAEWAEVDLRAGTWSIPRRRMKRKEEERGAHLIPIPPRLLTMMREWHREDGEGAVYVCPAPRGEGAVTREAIEKFYRRGLSLSGKHSPHSWRSVFSTWAHEAGKDVNAIDAQLDHVVGNKVAASYDRAKRLETRREIMAWHEAMLTAARDGAAVLPLAGRRSRDTRGEGSAGARR